MGFPRNWEELVVLIACERLERSSVIKTHRIGVNNQGRGERVGYSLPWGKRGTLIGGTRGVPNITTDPVVGHRMATCTPRCPNRGIAKLTDIAAIVANSYLDIVRCGRGDGAWPWTMEVATGARLGARHA